MTFDGNMYGTPFCLGGIFKGLFHYCNIMLLLIDCSASQKSQCVSNCLSESQLYNREYFFCISMPNRIPVFGSLSHMMEVWEILKLAMQRCMVALPSEDIDEPSAVFKMYCCR